MVLGDLSTEVQRTRTKQSAQSFLFLFFIVFLRKRERERESFGAWRRLASAIEREREEIRREKGDAGGTSVSWSRHSKRGKDWKWRMADDGEVSALVCDNGSGMVKVRVQGNWFDVQREGGLGLFFCFCFFGCWRAVRDTAKALDMSRTSRSFRDA